MVTPLGRWSAAALLVVVAAACSRSSDVPTVEVGDQARLTTTTSSSTTTIAPTTTVTAAATTVAPRPPTTVAPTTSTTHPHPPRVVTEEAWVPYATVGPVELHLPSDRVEAIGFHQSNLDGALSQTPLPSAPRWFTMSDRDRDTTARGAADVVVEPGREVRVPVSGTVTQGGTYTLYCDYVDQFVVINPDSRPGWQVKILHIEGLALRKGQRVEAGVTVLAAHARVLPFASQVEDDTGLPRWPHVHIEVDDPTVPDRPTGPGCP